MSGAVGFFKNIVLTNKGKKLLLSSNNNIDNSIDFTICKFGDGRYTEDEIPTAIDIKSAWKTQNINTVRIDNSESDPKLIVEITFSNKDMQEPKILNELGIFARDKQGSTHLFAYSLSNVETREEIEIENDYPTTFKISIISKISNKTNVTNIIDPNGFLTKEVIELLKENIRNIGFRKIKGTLNVGQKIIQVPTDILMPISERAVLNIEGEIYFLDRDYTIDTKANTITLKEPYSFNNDSMYEIIDPLPPTYVKEQIQEFIDDFKQLVSDSKVDFETLKERVFLEIQQKVDDFYTQLENYIEENKEKLKGHSIDRIVANGTDENSGNIYDILRDDDRKIGTIIAPKGDEGVGVVDLEYIGLTENGDTEYKLVLSNGKKKEHTFISPKGQKGDSFYIKKVYPSISDMEDDFSNEDVGIGEYVIISSNDDDNGKLFEKRIEGFHFIIDMSISIKNISLKETLPNGDKVYNMFLENGIKIGEFIASKGDIGPQGPRGEQGLQGPKGDIGLQGPSGLQGLKGERGEQGLQGERGMTGEQGPRGERGPIGPEGPKGLKGEKGERGEIGPQGPRGPQGERGLTGDIGPRGETGPQGPQGAPGINGKNLEFTWRETELGVRVEGQSDYQYVNLQGPQGTADIPIASNSVLGGIKIGNGITMDGEVANIEIDKHSYMDYHNTLIGFNSKAIKPSGSGNTILGRMTTVGTGNNNTILGQNLISLKNGNGNTLIGNDSLSRLSSGSYNTSVGHQALGSITTGSYNSSLGYRNGLGGTSYSYITVIGAGASVTGDHQIQLGSSNDTTYCYGTVQNRSDERDKTDIQDTTLGLKFLMKLRPREYRWDYREAYIDNNSIYEEIEIVNSNKKLSNEEKQIKIKKIIDEYSIEKVQKDGSKKGWRLHQGFIAQEVFQVMRELGVDFGGYQDHSINGGKDVLSIGYNEFIPVLVKGIQEQQKQIQEQQKQINNLLERVKILEKGGML